MDDMSLFNGNSGKIYGMDLLAMSSDNLACFSPTNFDSGFDYSQYFGNDVTTSDTAQIFRTTSADALYSQSIWYENPLGTVAESPSDLTTSPTGLYCENEWNIPSATSDFFSPSDLPLSARSTGFVQTISQSGESTQHSLPGLTASSSGAQSEIDGPAGNGNLEAFPAYWSSTVPFRESTPTASFAFPSSVPTFDANFKPTSSPRRHRQTYSGGAHHNGSGSTTTPGDVAYKSKVNIGHLQNLAVLKSAQEAAAARSASQSPSTFALSGESDVGAIAIPNTEDYYDEFDFPAQPDSQQSETSKQYSWLLDAQ
jgi:hypothetical protein